MIITTAGRTDQGMVEDAKRKARQLQIPFITRKKQSIQKIQEEVKDDCLVVGKQRLEIYPYGQKEPVFFHPNSAMFRIKRLQQGEKDPFIDATQLADGKKFLDCTFGLGSDSITASYVVGKDGIVTGCEGNRYLAYVMKLGLQTWDDGAPSILTAMRQIDLIPTLAIDFLKTLPDGSYDCVYFDPMFDENIIESDGISGIRSLAIYEDIDIETIQEAIRVAKERVVLKDHYRSKRFSQFGFEVQVRKTAKFHYGVLKK